MPRKYTRKTAGSETTEAFARGLADTMRPMIKQLLREAITEMFGDWMAKNATKVVPPEETSRLGPNGAPKRES